LEIVLPETTIVVGSISYLTDALADLVRIGISIATDRGIGAAILDHEPAISALVAETSWLEDDMWEFGARLSLIRNLDEWVEPTFKWRASVNADTVVRFTSRDELARLFLDMALRVHEAHGEEGYNKLWGGHYGYPRRAVAALEAALNCPANPPYNYGNQGMSAQ
jgi:hypothetical protein